MRGPAKKITTAVGKELSETPIRTTAAVATGSFFVTQAMKNKPPKDNGDLSSRIEEVHHPSPNEV